MSIKLFHCRLVLALVDHCHSLLLDNDNTTLLDDPNLVIHFLSKENLDRMEAYQLAKHGHDHFKTDFSAIDFYLYTPERGSADPFIFNEKTEPRELLENGFDNSRETKILVHGWRGRGDAWYITSLVQNITTGCIFMDQ